MEKETELAEELTEQHPTCVTENKSIHNIIGFIFKKVIGTHPSPEAVAFSSDNAWDSSVNKD